MKPIRDLKIVRINDRSAEAKFYRADDGLIYFKYNNDDDSKMECLKGSDIGHKWGCAECKYCYEKRNTNNDAKVLKPFSPCSHSCALWDNTDKYDIIFRMDGGYHRNCVCSNFEPKYNLPDWNVNQFIDVENCCEIPRYRHITGFSYKEEGIFKQIPFTFDIDIGLFEKGIIEYIQKEPVIFMHNVYYWTDGFNIDGELHRGLDEYIKCHNITDANVIKRIKKFKPKDYHMNTAIFSLKDKWFI